MWEIYYPFIKITCELIKIMIYYDHIAYIYNEMKYWYVGENYLFIY
jgi:hypothetical protein